MGGCALLRNQSRQTIQFSMNFMPMQLRQTFQMIWSSKSETPLQSGGTECGICVMRFMKELMLDSTLMTNNFYGKHMYSQKELDDIRVEWGLHFSKILAETEVGKLNADE